MFKKNKSNFDRKFDYNMILESPNLNYIKPLDTNKILNMKFGNEILNFSKKILSSSDINFSYFYSNIENLEIQNVGGLIKENTRAGYSVRYNSIAFKDYFNSYEIYHELLHLSSAIFDSTNYVEFCGFSQYNYKIKLKIGVSLNEGYTEYLNEKLFGNYSNAYIIEKNLSMAVEQIVGSTLMKKMYFKADLKSLIGILSKYNNLDDTMKFIEAADYISNNSNIIFDGKKIDKEFSETIEFIVKYLISTYITKLDNDFEENTISKDEYDEKIENYINKIGSFNYYDNGSKYSLRFISERKILKIYNKIIKDIKK